MFQNSCEKERNPPAEDLDEHASMLAALAPGRPLEWHQRVKAVPADEKHKVRQRFSE